MPGDQDARPFCVPVRHVGGRGLAKLLDVPGVEQLHDPQVLPAQLQRDSQQALEVEVHIRHRREQCLLDERADRLVRLAQPPRMAGVRRHALQSVEDQLLHRLNVLVLAAHSGTDHTTRPLRRLLTLVAEHRSCASLFAPARLPAEPAGQPEQARDH